MKTQYRISPWSDIALLIGAAQIHMSAASLTTIPCSAWAVSDDGGKVAADIRAGNVFEPALWSESDGCIRLGGNGSSLGISGDGLVVVGTGNEEGFRWTQTNGMVGLGYLPGGASSSALDASGDGSVVVGNSTGTNGPEAYRWTQATGMIGLGDLPGGTFFSRALAVSADGSVIAGESQSDNGREGFVWTQSTGMAGLGEGPGGITTSSATCVSGDGKYVGGVLNAANGYREAFLWTAAGGVVGLGHLPDSSSFARAVSNDGLVVVGQSIGPNGAEAFRWTPSGGMVRFWDALVAAGLDPGADGWVSFGDAYDVTPDGRFVVGGGHRNGDPAAVGFLADFGPAAPTKPTLVISHGVGGLIASWPAGFSTYSLEAASSLPGPANWAAVSTAPVLNGGAYEVPIPASEAAEFFRLRQSQN